MGRWPRYGPTVPPILSPYSMWPFAQWHANVTFANASKVITQNRINYWPLELAHPCKLTKFFWINGATVNGNVDIGFYTAEGNLIAAAGSTVQTGTSAKQEVATSAVLPEGYVYLAFVTNSATATFWIMDPWDGFNGYLWGCKLQAGTFPLPTTATFASAANMGLGRWGALVSPRTVV